MQVIQVDTQVIRHDMVQSSSIWKHKFLEEVMWLFHHLIHNTKSEARRHNCHKCNPTKKRKLYKIYWLIHKSSNTSMRDGWWFKRMDIQERVEVKLFRKKLGFEGSKLKYLMDMDQPYTNYEEELIDKK